MAQVLLRVVRRRDEMDIFVEGARRTVYILNPDHMDPERGQPHRDASFFLVDTVDADHVIRTLAQHNPGCEVQQFTMEKSGVCPPGDFVMKAVTKDGVLPI